MALRTGQPPTLEGGILVYTAELPGASRVKCFTHDLVRLPVRHTMYTDHCAVDLKGQVTLSIAVKPGSNGHESCHVTRHGWEFC